MLVMIIMSPIKRFFEEEKAQIKRLGNTLEELHYLEQLE